MRVVEGFEQKISKTQLYLDRNLRMRIFGKPFSMQRSSRGRKKKRNLTNFSPQKECNHDIFYKGCRPVN